MTLKEKVAEIQPNKVNEHISGEIVGCPWCYPYLHHCLNADEIENQMCSMAVGLGKCEICWNRKYIEQEKKS